jgi:hypothetical protein
MTKIMLVMICLALIVMAMASTSAVALDLDFLEDDDYWVYSTSETFAYVGGEGALTLNTSTMSEIAIGASFEEIIADTTSETYASGADYMVLWSNSTTTKHTPEYEETTTISSMTSTKINGMTSTKVPIGFSGEQRINNLLDTETPGNRKIETIMENILSSGGNSYTFEFLGSLPLEEGLATLPPIISADFSSPFSSNFDDFKIGFETGAADTIEADGLIYTGRLMVGLKLTVEADDVDNLVGSVLP